MRRIVVAGGSLAGHQVAHTLRDRGYDGDIIVVGRERHRPYDRYPLSKGFLSGETARRGLDLADDIPDVVWRLGETVTGVDLAAGEIATDTGDRIRFDRLVIATGSRPRDKDAVGRVTGAYVLRDVEDAVRLREALTQRDRRVVVVGGGLIGAEVAAAAVNLGHHTTLVDPSDVPSLRALGMTVATHLQELHRAAGVRLRTGTRARGMDVSDGTVRGVVLQDGTTLPADIVVMATGTRPNVEWLRGSGLDVEGGVACDATLHAHGCDRVVVAGDVARAPHPLLGGDAVRVEHWASTRQHATLAADNLLAGPASARPLTERPEFGTTIHGARIRAIGFPQVADDSRVVWGSLDAGSAVALLSRGGTAVAAISVNAPEALPEWAARL